MVDIRTSSARVRAGNLAKQQFGRVSRAQLARLELDDALLARWIAGGYLHRVLPRVFAVGHEAPCVEADLFAAVLYAGPGAMLSHLSAACWLGLIDHPGRVIQVTTARRCRSQPGIQVFDRRRRDRALWRGMPVTTVEETVLGLAAEAKPTLVRKALGRLDFRQRFNPDALSSACGRGRRGSAVLKQALTDYDPRFGYTNGPLEDDFIAFCERYDVLRPEAVNVRVHGILVDAYYPAHDLVVELDGEANHSTPAQIRRDRASELTLRGHGLDVIRYDWDQVHRQPGLVRADLSIQLETRVH